MKISISKSSIKILLSILVLILSLNPAKTFANGAAWHASLPTGVPGPLQQSELYLDHEHVLIKNGKIQARFWVTNPLDKEIEVLMGFPIGYKNDKGNKRRFPGFEREPSGFLLESEAKHSDVLLVKDIKNDYPIVYNWTMTFPAKQTTEFTVSYFNETGESDDYNMWVEFFTYITHTGSYWARPIPKAIIEYCNSDFIGVMKNIPSGNDKLWIDKGDAEIEVEWTVNPKQYKIDNARKCIIWERTNWSPKAYEDDIDVVYKWLKKTFVGENGFIGKSREGFILNVCGKGYNPDEHLGAAIGLSENKMSEQRLDEILLEEIAKHSEDLGYDINASMYPTHIRSDLQLLVLSYLRNYLYALHGHEFKDETLARCFDDISPNNEWTPSAKVNLKLIQSMEKRIKAENKSAWGKVKQSMQNKGAIKTRIKL